MLETAPRGIQPSWRCLELGAGAGSIAHWLASRCPDGQVVATDLGTTFLAARSAPNLRVLRHEKLVCFPPTQQTRPARPQSRIVIWTVPDLVDTRS